VGNYLLKNGTIINRGKRVAADVLIRKERIERIDSIVEFKGRVTEIDCTDRWILPGLIDDQVHFREPGLTHKATIASESRAALAGGVTSFMEMPNTKPPAFTQTLLEEKYEIASRTSAANYSFYMGTSNDNLEEVLKTDPKSVCGVKIFMGSSTGNLLVDNPRTLERLFGEVPMLIATHCEDEEMIKANLEDAIRKYGKAMPPSAHAVIRSRQSCLKSSSFAVSLAKKYGTRLHILHISTKEETMLFDADIPLAHKRITSEACVHHMSFSDKDYVTLGNKIKCNPAIKTAADRAALREALREGRIDIIATDHAPHTRQEKAASDYLLAPAGLPLVQEALPAALELYHDGLLDLPGIVARTAHNPAIRFAVKERGFLREGYFADITLVDLEHPTEVAANGVLSRCGWSPFEGMTLRSRVVSTLVNGTLAWHDGRVIEHESAMRLDFDRDRNRS